MFLELFKEGNPMNELAEKLQRVINTIETVDIKATFDNMNKLLGSLQTLAEVRDALTNMKEVNADE